MGFGRRWRDDVVSFSAAPSSSSSSTSYIESRSWTTAKNWHHSRESLVDGKVVPSPSNFDLLISEFHKDKHTDTH